jgi:hypothetical protein
MINPGIGRLGCRNRIAMTVEAIAIPSVPDTHWINGYRDPGDAFTIG